MEINFKVAYESNYIERIWRCRKPGSSGITIPRISENEVLVKVKAFSINPVDVKTRKGEALAASLRNEKPIILGWDISGIIVEIGKNINSLKINDEVFGMVNFVGHGKAYAE